MQLWCDATVCDATVCDNVVSYTDLCESMNHKLRHVSESQRRSRHPPSFRAAHSTLNSSKELLTDQSYCNSNFFPQPSLYYILYGQIREEDRIASIQAPVPTDFFLDCSGGPSPPCRLQRSISPSEGTAATEI